MHLIKFRELDAICIFLFVLVIIYSKNLLLDLAINLNMFSLTFN